MQQKGTVWEVSWTSWRRKRLVIQGSFKHSLKIKALLSYAKNNWDNVSISSYANGYAAAVCSCVETLLPLSLCLSTGITLLVDKKCRVIIYLQLMISCVHVSLLPRWNPEISLSVADTCVTPSTVPQTFVFLYSHSLKFQLMHQITELLFLTVSSANMSVQVQTTASRARL